MSIHVATESPSKDASVHIMSACIHRYMRAANIVGDLMLSMHFAVL